MFDIGKDLQDAFDDGYEKAMQDRWIPISERLPEEDGFYNVTLNHKKTCVEFLYYCLKNNTWEFVADGSISDNTDWREKCSDVLAWQPLPKPYQPE